MKMPYGKMPNIELRFEPKSRRKAEKREKKTRKTFRKIFYTDGTSNMIFNTSYTKCLKYFCQNSNFLLF